MTLEQDTATRGTAASGGDQAQAEPEATGEVAQALHALDSVVAATGGQQRPGQRTMAQAVAGALDGDRPLLVEAGTGTGKSFAYLAPALRHAVAHEERVVVSTATLALQRQVLAKDLPRVAEALADDLPREPQVALLKGWHNYVCRHKLAGGYPSEDDALFALDRGADHPGAEPGEGLGEQVVRVREWAETTETGDRDELVPGVTDRAWRQVSVPAMDCLGTRCPLLEECFPEAARRASREADVVVTNHAMLGIAASGSTGVLPEHDVLVVDEAHELVARSRSAATAELSASAVERVARSARRGAGVVLEDLDAAAVALAQSLREVAPGRLKDGADEILLGVVTQLGAACREGLRATKPGEGSPPSGGLTSARSALTALVEVCDRLLSDSVAMRRDVLWCTEREDGSKRLWIAPLEVAPLVAENLLADHHAVLTSATLRVGGEFTSFAHDIGLHKPEEYTSLAVPAPFDYRSQAIRYIAGHLPAPSSGISEAALAELTELITASGGGALGLFSSRRAAERAAEHVRASTDLEVLCQGDDVLPTLVSRFAADPAVSLFGTLSLWQGVDVPGPSNRLVIIDRIPFPRPDDPIVQALSEAATARGANDFMAVSATHAALLLAQGVGRLIRATSDRGVVAILDSRLARARYAPFLLRSLPDMWPTTDPALVRAALTRLAGGITTG